TKKKYGESGSSLTSCHTKIFSYHFDSDHFTGLSLCLSVSVGLSLLIYTCVCVCVCVCVILSNRIISYAVFILNFFSLTLLSMYTSASYSPCVPLVFYNIFLLVTYTHLEIQYRGWSCGSEVEHLPGLREVLGSILSTTYQQRCCVRRELRNKY
ncbi:hypothetical protein H1C71_040949, partial [Ictidomys tridecemlineatus]